MLTRPVALWGGREPCLEAEPSALLPPPIKPGSLGNGGWRGGMEEKAFDGGAGEQSRSPGRPDAGIRGRRGQQTAGPSCGSLLFCHLLRDTKHRPPPPSPTSTPRPPGARSQQTFPRPPNCQGALRRRRTPGCVPTRGRTGLAHRCPERARLPPAGGPDPRGSCHLLLQEEQ